MVSGIVSSNSRVNHSFKIQNSCNQFGSKPAQMTEITMNEVLRNGYIDTQEHACEILL